MDHSRVLVLVLCGLPGTGKTSLARELSTCSFASQGFVSHHICFDEIYEIVFGTSVFDPANWHASRQEALRRVVRLLQELSDRPLGAEERHIIIVDDNNHLRSMRKTYSSLCRKCSVSHF